MKKVLLFILCQIFIISMTCTGVFAVTISTYNPVKSNKVTVLFNAAYSGASGDQVAVKGDGYGNVRKVTKVATIKPVRPEYHYGILPRKDGTKKVTIIRKGKNYGMKMAKEFANAMCGGNQTTKEEMIASAAPLLWFKASDYPEVEYRGYHLFDKAQNTYVNVVVRAKLVSYSKSYKAKGAATMKTPAIAFSDVSKDEGEFAGLPTLIINCIGNAQVRYTFLKANADGTPGSTTYPVKTNVTYDDIDCFQAISIKKDNSYGFSATSKAKGNLKFGDPAEYWAVNSNTATQKSDQSQGNYNWDQYAMCYYLNSSEVNMIYTSNQRKVSENKQTGTPDAPNGSWSYFSTSTYHAAPTDISLDKPEKKVYDSDSSNDVKQDNTHNKINTTNEGFYYTVTQVIPKGLSDNTALKYGLESLIFNDKLDSCLEIDGSVRFYKNSIGTDNDVTSSFSNLSDGQDLSFKTTDKSLINMSGSGGKIIMKIPVKIKRNGDELINHMSDNLRNDNRIHRIEDSNNLDIPNEASVLYQTLKKKTVSSTGSDTERYTDTVQTRVPFTPKHDLEVIKQVTGVNVSMKKRFKYTITLNNGSVFNGTIKRNDGSTEKISIEDEGIYELAHGDRLTIRNIPQTVQYTIREEGAEKYTPSFILSNPGDCLETGTASGSAAEGRGLAVTDIFSNAGNDQAVAYTFNNRGDNPPPYTHEDPGPEPSGYMLRTEKTEEPVTGQLFDFETILQSLTDESYMVMRPGSGHFVLSMNRAGDIVVAADHYNSSLENIPVKLIRPCDKGEKIFYTDENGIVSSDKFDKWLSEKQDGSYDFQMEWNGGYVTGHYDD